MEKRMVIMGATSGIGRKVAELYIGRGWRVGVAGRRVHLLEELKRMNPVSKGRAHAILKRTSHITVILDVQSK